jgi:hypothetical protein
VGLFRAWYALARAAAYRMTTAVGAAEWLRTARTASQARATESASARIAPRRTVTTSTSWGCHDRLA